MAVTTTLSFQEKMSKHLSAILRSIGSTLDALDDLEDAASDLEDALDHIDHSSIAALDASLSDARRQAGRLATEIADVDHHADAIDATEIVRLEKALRNVAKAGDDAKESLGQVDDVAGGMEGLGGAAAVGGAAITGGLAVAATQAYEMEHAMNVLGARVGATDEELANMRTSVEGVFTSGLVETPQEAAEAFGRFRHLLEGTDEEIRKVTEGALGLEQMSLGDLDQDSTAKALNALEEQWGTAGTKGLDMIATVYERVGDQADDLLDTIWEYSPQFKEAGVSAEKMMGMLAAGMDGGAFNFDKLGDAFKESFGIRLGKALDENALGALESMFGEEKMFGLIDQIKAGGKEAEAAITTITAGIAAIDDAGTRDDVLSNIFGTQYEDAGRQAVMAMLNAKPLEDFEGKAAEVAAQTANEWQAMSNEIKTSMMPIGDIVLEVLEPTVGLLASIASGIGDFAEEHPTIAKFTVVFAGIFGVLMLLGGALALATFAMSGFSIATLAALWPIVAIMAGVAALVAAGWWLYSNWGEITGFLSEVWQGVQDKWFSSIEAIKSWFVTKFTEISDWFDGWISGLFDSGRKIVTTIVDGIMSVAHTVGDAISNAFEWADRFLPHSDADAGPFSRLTDSGMAIPETMAEGVQYADGALGAALIEGFGDIPLEPLSSDANPNFSPPTFVPSMNTGGMIEAASGPAFTENKNSTYVDFRPTIQITTSPLNGGGDSNMDDEKFAEQLASILADELEHRFAGIGQAFPE